MSTNERTEIDATQNIVSAMTPGLAHAGSINSGEHTLLIVHIPWV